MIQPLEWTDTHLRLVQSWQEQCMKEMKGHQEIVDKCKRLHLAVSVPPLILVPVIFVLSFAFQNNNQCINGSIAIASMSGVAMCLAGLREYFKWDHQETNHYALVVHYDNLKKHIETILSASPQDRHYSWPVNATLDQLKSEFFKINERSLQQHDELRQNRASFDFNQANQIENFQNLQNVQNVQNGQILQNVSSVVPMTSAPDQDSHVRSSSSPRSPRSLQSTLSSTAVTEIPVSSIISATTTTSTTTSTKELSNSNDLINFDLHTNSDQQKAEQYQQQRFYFA